MHKMLCIMMYRKGIFGRIMHFPLRVNGNLNIHMYQYFLHILEAGHPNSEHNYTELLLFVNCDRQNFGCRSQRYQSLFVIKDFAWKNL